MSGGETIAEPAPGHVKATRNDWLDVAMETLIADGVERVKVQPLAQRLGVSRSSFYWYFRDRQHLLDALLDHWLGTNTAALVAQAEAPAETITGAVCNVFRCVIDARLFDTRLDFAVRDWARRSAPVRDVFQRSDARRLAALTAMFARHGYTPDEAETRARVVYYMQIGYDDADLRETLETRLARVPMYLYCFTGQQPLDAEVAAFRAYAKGLETGEDT